MELIQCLILVVLLNKIAVDGECNNGCVGEKCHKNGTCTDGCRHGYTGAQCDTCLNGRYMWRGRYCLACPYRCNSCSNYDECTSCATGFYNHTCRPVCARGCTYNRCDMNGICTFGCLPGYYGAKCKPCPNGCLKGNCNTTVEECETCRTGWYKRNNKCYECGYFCESCKARYTCQSCLPGLYDTRCNLFCPFGCNNNECKTDDSNRCIKVCKPGYVGTYCKRCSQRCLYGECDATDGSCNCQDGYNGTNCENCLPGWFKMTESCIKCPDNCHTCFDLENCQSCKLGYYGYKCHNDCSSGCKFKTCNQLDGTCTHGCKSGYYDETCVPCSHGCLNKECNVTDGTCACQSNCIGTKCDNCQIGWYKNGDTCLPCSTGCFNSICNVGNGSCDCQRGYTGVRCEHCLTGWYKNNGFCLKYTGHSGNTAITVGISVAIVVLAIIITIVTGVIMVRKRLRQFEKAHAPPTEEVELAETTGASDNNQYEALRMEDRQHQDQFYQTLDHRGNAPRENAVYQNMRLQ